MCCLLVVDCWFEVGACCVFVAVCCLLTVGWRVLFVDSWNVCSRCVLCVGRCVLCVVC